MKIAKIFIAITTLLSILGIVGLCVVVFLMFAAGSPTQAPEKPAETPSHKPVSRSVLLKLVNRERAKVGVHALKMMPELNKTAQLKANEMAKLEYFGHYNPETGKSSGLDFMRQHTRCAVIAENLIYNPSYPARPARDAVDGWLSSPSHRKAMLNPRYETTGFGIKNGRIVQHFCQM